MNKLSEWRALAPWLLATNFTNMANYFPSCSPALASDAATYLTFAWFQTLPPACLGLVKQAPSFVDGLLCSILGLSQPASDRHLFCFKRVRSHDHQLEMLESRCPDNSTCAIWIPRGLISAYNWRLDFLTRLRSCL